MIHVADLGEHLREKLEFCLQFVRYKSYTLKFDDAIVDAEE